MAQNHDNLTSYFQIVISLEKFVKLVFVIPVADDGLG